MDNDSQRAMYNNPENLTQLVVGPSRKFLLEPPFPQILVSGYHPEDNLPNDLRLTEIYDLMRSRKDIKELTFSVRKQDKKVVIW